MTGMNTINDPINPATAMQINASSLKISMRRKILAVGAALVLASTLASHALTPSLMALPDHVPAIVSQLTPTGDLNASNQLHLAIGLPIRNGAALTNLLEQIYDPSSTNYHHYLTPQQFAEQFGPTEQDYAKVADFARASGFTVSGTHPNRLVLDVQGTVAGIETTFHVKLRTYNHPKENRTFYAPDSEPVVDSSLPILHISGMDNYYLMHPRSNLRLISSIPNAIPNAGSGPQGTFIGADFRKAYVPGTPLTGTGQNVGLLQFDGYFPSDPAAYAQMIGLTNPPNLVNVPIDGGVPNPGSGNGEVCLDIEMTMAMAPGVSNIYVYEAPNPSPWVDILSRMANDNLASQLSCSWGGGPPDASAEQIFQQMALQGQTFFCAVGDTDAFTDNSNPITFPSDSPNITEVGGTTLTTADNGSFLSEIVWNWRIPNGNGGNWGSSGGISTYYSIPTWQQGIDMTSNHGSKTYRNTPDVALTADNIFLIADGGQSYASGGTSAASPLWAAFIALANQQGAASGHAPVGFLNPTIYALAKGDSYTKVFRDVTVGDNFWQPDSPTNFPAVTGYDLCTGLGSPNGTNLINALTSGAVVTNTITHYSPPPPPYGGALASLNGNNPNGTWQLFVLDDAPFNAGIISNGWMITVTTANPVGYSANLALGMTASASTLTLSNYLTYTLTVTNLGPSTSSNALVVDTLPLGVSFVSASTTNGYLSGLNWYVGNLAANTSAQLVLKVLPRTVGTIQNYAIATASTSDGNTDDNFATVPVAVTLPSPPQVSVPAVGSNGMFQLSISGPAVSTVIQASTNLVDWVNISTNTPPFNFVDPGTSNYTSRFYRAVVIQ